MNDELSLKDSLNQVRKAYRIVWSYQSRVIDIIRIISDQFEHEFYYWNAAEGSTGNSTTDPLKSGAGSLLPFLALRMLFLRSESDRNAPKAGDWMLEIDVKSDDGYDEASEVSKDPIDFAQTDSCRSLIFLRAWYVTKDARLNWAYGIWHKTDWPEEQDIVVEHDNPPVKVISRTMDLTDLPNKAAVLEAVEDFKRLLERTLGLEFSRP